MSISKTLSIKMDYIKISADEIEEYFYTDLIDGVFQKINKTIDRIILTIDKDGIGYVTCPEVPVKDQPPHNLFIEYRLKVVGPKDQVPIPVETYLTDIRIFQDWPESIKKRMREMEKEIEGYENKRL